jgi:hypothetical protein
MRGVCWLSLVSALFASLLGCDSSDSKPEHRADADVGADAGGGQRDVGSDAADAQRDSGELELDASVRADAEPDAQALPMDAGADAGMPRDSDSEDDSDGGADPGADGIRFEGGDGSSCREAVVIEGADSELEGIGAEYTWLRDHYPGARVVSQSLGSCEGDWTDILSIRTASGNMFDVYFDIEDFFGK